MSSGSDPSTNMPRRIAPQLIGEMRKPPPALPQPRWKCEVKWDGYRMMVRLSGGQVALFSKNGEDWSARLPGLAQSLRGLQARDAWIDGEVCVIDSRGRSNFARLQGSVTARTSAAVQLVAFDVLWLDGEDLRAKPLRVRRQRLRELLQRSKCEKVNFSDDLEGSPHGALEAARDLELEGVVVKDQESLYEGGRRPKTWLKLKCRRRGLFVVIGWSDASGSSSARVGSLDLGRYEDGRLRRAGSVGTGWSGKEAVEMRKALMAIEETSPSQLGIGGEVKLDRGAHRVTPIVVVEVEFAEARGESLRHPALVAVRPDFEPKDARG